MRFICLFALLALMLPPPARTAAWNDEVGLELESLKSKMGSDMPGALKEAHAFGFKYVELVGDYHLPPETLTNRLRQNQLTAVSAHFPYARFRDDPDGLADEAEKLGLKYVGCPGLPQGNNLDLAGCQAAIAVFDRAGSVLASHHITFFYHPHGYEFKPYKKGTMFDLLVTSTKPKFVHFQMDIFWVVHAGQDPVKLLQKYGNRWVSMHLKDMRKGAETGIFTGHADRSDFVPIGQGQIDMPAVLRAAHQAGIRWFFVEDESSSPEDGIRESIPFLQKTGW